MKARRGGRPSGLSVRMRAGVGWSAISERASQQFTVAAEAGASAAAEVARKNGRGGTWGLGIRIVGSCRLYAAQRRSQRLLPGGADTMTAAAYVLGGIVDSEVRSLLGFCISSVPRDSRCKAIERALKGRIRADIVQLNRNGSREARADNLAAVRICVAVADILTAHSAHSMAADFTALRAAAAEKDATIAALRAQLDSMAAGKVGTDKRPRACWCGGRPLQDHMVGASGDIALQNSNVSASLPIGVASHSAPPPFMQTQLPPGTFGLLSHNNLPANIGQNVVNGGGGGVQLFLGPAGGYHVGAMVHSGQMDGMGGDQ